MSGSRAGAGLLIASLALLPAPARAADLVLYDEDAASQWRDMERAVEVADAAYQGRVGIRVEPTHWHQPFLRLPQRTDFRRYDELAFFIRSPEGPMEQSLLARDYASGSRVDLSTYVQGGVIDERWREVRIPLEALASEAFGLESVFLLLFAEMAEPRPFHLDSVVLRQTSGPRVTGHSVKSSRALTVSADAFDHAASASPENYLITSDTDPLYRPGQSPIAVGSDRKAIGVSDGGWGVDRESRLHLLLPYPLREGHGYRVGIGGMIGENGIGAETAEVGVRFDPRAVSSSIKVNQVGYAPLAPKIAYVGNWLGDLGAMPVDAGEFAVVDAATGERVFTGSLSLRLEADPQSGEDVYEADFSPVTQPGRYAIQVDGIGRSDPFTIATDVYDGVYRTVMRFLYHKRNTTLSAPFADPGFEREGVDPGLDGVYHPVLADYPLSSGEVPYAYRPIDGGWFDAGDYGHYVHNAALVWFCIGVAMDLAPDGHFADGELNIPESGNGVPDILDELSWGMDWAMSMQDRSDGGVYWRLSSGAFDTGLPSAVSEPRFIYEKTTRATAQFAAMGAIFARLIQDYDAPRAALVLDAAEQAWEFVRTRPIWPAEGTLYRNPTEHPGGGEYSLRSSKPDMEWAAAELYRTTGDVAYQDAYRTLVDETPFDVTRAPETTPSRWAMVMAGHGDRDPVLVEEARRAIMTAADIKLRWSRENLYRAPKHPSIQLTGWHSFSGAVMAAVPLLQAYYLSAAPTYAAHAWLMPNVTLGANPLSMSFITGVGARAPLDPMDRISLEDDAEEPVRGMPVPGPTWHLPAFREPYIGANAAYYPPEAPLQEGDYATAYPVLRRYTDAHGLIPMNEGTVREAALTAVAFGLLRDSDSHPVTADVPYDWDPGEPKRARVLGLTDIPLADVPLLRPDQIAAFGYRVGVAHPDWLRALGREQVAAIDAPAVPYWVGKLDPDQRLALTPEQIAGFEQWSLFTALPAAQVPHIPPGKIAGLGLTIVNTTQEWKAALTTAQIDAMTPEQRAVLAKAGLE